MSIKNKIGRTLRTAILRRRLRTRDFTIISNNCWGAHIYSLLGEPYRTPFVGLFVAPACYVTLVPKLRWYLRQPLHFLKQSRHDYINLYREEQKLAYPIGCLGDDVEIHFQHYPSEVVATEKWNRRVGRITSDDSRLFFKFCDRDGCSPAHLAAFDAAPVAHKVCFVAKPAPDLQSAIWIPGCTDGRVPDGFQLSNISRKYFDAAGWINGTDGRPQRGILQCV